MRAPEARRSTGGPPPNALVVLRRRHKDETVPGCVQLGKILASFLRHAITFCQCTKMAALTVASVLRKDRNPNGGGLCNGTRNGVACGYDGRTKKTIRAIARPNKVVCRC